MARWRLIVDDDASASFGLAADEYLLGHYRGPGGSFDATLRLYTYRSHCALVGRFQHTAAEVRLDECARLGVAVNRRPTGGGAILMGRDQLGIALALDGARPDLPRQPGALFQHLVAGVVAGLRQFDLEARFRPKNDLELDGRKIAGLGLCRDTTGGLLFHTSLLVDLDLGLMLRVLAIPPEKLSDKLLRLVADRTTTLVRACARPVPLDEARAAVRDGFAAAFGAELVLLPFTAQELAAIRELEDSKYTTAAWVHQGRLAEAEGDSPELLRAALGGACFGLRANAVGQSVRKTAAGLLRVYVALSGETIKSVLITGDFFADAAALARLEARLKWAPADLAVIREAARAEWHEAGPAELAHGDLADAIWHAAERARGARRGT